MKTFKLKVVLHFNDGINKGTLKIKASSLKEAHQICEERMRTIWQNVLRIEIK